MDHIAPFKRACLAAVLASATSGAFAASDQQAMTGETFEDWTVGCQQEICIAAQTSFGPQETWLATVRLRQEGQGRAAVQVIVPAGVHLGSGLFIQLKAQPPIEVPFINCTPETCQAAVMLPPETVEGWKRARTVSMRYRPALDAAPVEFDISMMGVTAALSKTGAPG